MTPKEKYIEMVKKPKKGTIVFKKKPQYKPNPKGTFV